MTGTNGVLLVLAAGAAGLGGGLLAGTLESDAAPAVAPAETRDPVARARLRALEERLARELEEVRSDGAVAPRPGKRPRGGAPAAGRAAEPEAVGTEAAGDPVAALLGELATRPYTHRRSERLFEHLARRHGAIDGTIARLREALEEDPENAELHAALGTALAAKTAFATPPGPEQGEVWREAEKSFLAAIEREPEHWEARYSLAFGDSMAPEFVGLRPRAIRRFEELMEIQEHGAPADEHSLVYLRLGTLLKDAGNVGRARAVWERGRERHPENGDLERALRLLGEEGR